MIIEEYDESLFIQRFENMRRVETEENPNGNFSYKGLIALFGYLDESFDKEKPYKLDVVSLCCEYSEYRNIEEYLKDYPTDLKKDDYEDLNDYKEAVETEINDDGTLIKFEDDLDEGFIVNQQ